MSLSRYFVAYCVRPVRALGIVVLIIGGFATLALLFPWMNQARRGVVIQYWSRMVLYTVGIRLSVTGTRPERAALLVANHVSWADPFLLIACYPVYFVAKAEIRQWPVLGRLAALSGTIFIRRERQRDLNAVARACIDYLDNGKAVGLFPESTTSDGTQLLRFKPALFQVAVSTAADCYPVALSYDQSAAIWVENMGFVTSLWHVLGLSGMTAHIHFCPAIHYCGQHRRDLALASETAITTALYSAALHTPLEKPVDLPTAAR